MEDEEGERLVDALRKFGTEATNIEAKSARTALPKSAKESVVAFANSSTGGTLILGLDESGGFAATGVADPGKMQADLAASCATEIKPPIRPDISLLRVEGSTLVVAEIPALARELKPAYVDSLGMNRGSFIRTGESDRRLTTEEIQQLLADRGQPLFDREVVEEATRADLDLQTVDRFVRRLRDGQPHIFRDESDESILRMTNVIKLRNGVERPTIAGLLALGRYPQQFFPQLNATLVVYGDRSDSPTNSDIRFLDNVRLDGNLPTIVAGAMAALRRNMARKSMVTGDGRMDIYDYPPEALREVVVNALVHRDLSPGARGTQVQIEMFQDLLRLKNPGGLFGSVDVTQLGDEGRSSARNGTLLRILEDVVMPGDERAICENRGSGIRQVKSALKEANLSPPEFKDSVTAFNVILPNHALFDDETVAWLRAIGQEGLKDSQVVALALMRRGQIFDNATYRAATGNADSHAARTELQDLVARELIDQLGSRGGTKYVLSAYATSAEPGNGTTARVRPDRRRQIAGQLALHGPLSKTEISERLGVSPKTAEHWLRILKKEEVVEPTEVGSGRRSTRYRLAASGEEPLFPTLDNEKGPGVARDRT